MEGFVEFESINGRKVFCKADNITFVLPDDDTDTISLISVNGSGKCYRVKGTPEEVIEKIGEAYTE